MFDTCSLRVNVLKGNFNDFKIKSNSFLFLAFVISTHSWAKPPEPSKKFYKELKKHFKIENVEVSET